MGKGGKSAFPAYVPAVALSALIGVLGGCGRAAPGEPTGFPRRPIRVVVYTGPGGMIDTTARRFVQIAARYSDATFVVENRPGAGGMVAIKRVLEMPADGHTLYACTRSTISAIVAARGESYLAAMDWIGMLMADPECVIVRRDAKVNDWQRLVDDARRRPGHQIWVGPDMGGLDHLVARKTWARAGIDARWVPFDSGAKAKAALLAGRGVAYVGNPREVLGNDQLKIAALARAKRIAPFPDAPTFEELGVRGLAEEAMWRGFAVKRGTPTEAIAWYDRLFREVAADPRWREFWQRGGIDVAYRDREAFTPIVRRDVGQFRRHLAELGVLPSGGSAKLARWFAAPRLWWVLAAMLLVSLTASALLTRTSPGGRLGDYLIPALLLSLACLLLGVSFTFPARGPLGAAAVPRLWIALLVPLTLYLLYDAARRPGKTAGAGRAIGRTWSTIGLLALYVLGIGPLGYYLATALFLVATMRVLGTRRAPRILGVVGLALLVSYWLFARLLHVPLPTGPRIGMGIAPVAAEGRGADLQQASHALRWAKPGRENGDRAAPAARIVFHRPTRS